MPADKPEACRGCPCAGDMTGWVPDKIDPEAEVLAITLFPTQYEATKGIPAEGMTFEEYQKEYQKYAGSVSMSYANVIRCRGQRGTKLPTGAKLASAARFCRQYDNVPSAVKLVVFQGADVVKALRPDISNPTKWRGFLAPVERGKEAKGGGEDV